MLTSWVTLIFLTAEEVGRTSGHRCLSRQDKPSGQRDSSQCSQDSGNPSAADGATATSAGPRGSKEGGSIGDTSAMGLGMRRFVKRAIVSFAGGTRLADLMELQVRQSAEDRPKSALLPASLCGSFGVLKTGAPV